MIKNNYYYIDESGHLINNSNIFIHGCIKTDTPENINNAIDIIKSSIRDNIYFQDPNIINDFIKNGFHAVENHPDIRAQLYMHLPLLNYRAYFVLLKKTDSFYKNLINNSTPSEVFTETLKKLLINRIISNKYEKHIFCFETIEFSDITLKSIIDNIFNKYFKKYKIEYSIVNKNENNLSVIDYLNYILYQIIEGKKYMERMKQNFELIKPKIGLIYFMNKDLYYGRQSKVDLNNIFNIIGGC